MKKKIIVFIYIFASIAGFVLFGDAGQTDKKETKDKKKKNRIIAAPVAFYSPETSVALGGAGSYVFRMAGKEKNTRPSTISPLVIYTFKKQFIAQLNTDLYFKDNKYRLTGEIKRMKYPNKFYGIGRDTLEENEEAFTGQLTNFFLTFRVNMGRGFNIGLLYHFTDWEVVETETGGLLDSGLVTGVGKGVISGAGLVLSRDTRDNIYFPTKGVLHEFNARMYRKSLGGDYNFTEFSLDMRKYFTLFSTHVFAVRGLVKRQNGTVPFMNLAKLGGPFVMRGYYEGRFRDTNLLVMEAEYRLPLFKKFGMVAFGGLGNVAPSFKDLGKGALKPSYGFGFRYLFDKKEKIWLRLDFGFGKGTSGFYFSIFEAF